MACFIVPAAEAVVVKVCEKVAASKETETTEAVEHKVGIPLKRKLKWLNYMLIGGSVHLARRDSCLVPVFIGHGFSGRYE